MPLDDYYIYSGYQGVEDAKDAPSLVRSVYSGYMTDPNRQKEGLANASSHQKGLTSAKKNKKDEFYTQITDIEKELKHYKKHFKNATIFCNCDDPTDSHFFRYFALNFEHLGLKKLITTHYDATQPTYKLEITRGIDINDDGKFDEKDVRKTPLRQNGDFRSQECVSLLEEADIIVTNPPFSLFREYIAQLIEYKKKFIILGNVNAVTYKEIFPLIKDEKIWLGPSISSGDREFRVPDDYELNASGFRVDVVTGTKYIRVKGVRWFTNLDFPKRHEKLELWKKYTPEEYPTYDNYNAINVGKVAEIPEDYDDIMGVPITFLDKYNPKQFEILGITQRDDAYGLRTKKYTKEDDAKFNDLNARSVIKTEHGYKAQYARILIRNRKERQ